MFGWDVDPGVDPLRTDSKRVVGQRSSGGFGRRPPDQLGSDFKTSIEVE